MDTRIVIIANGPAGILVANRLRRRAAGGGPRIVVVDNAGENAYRDAETDLLTAIGLLGPRTLQPPEDRRLRDGIATRRAGAVAVDLAREEVLLTDGGRLGYDVLVIAAGAGTSPASGPPAAGADPYTLRAAVRPNVFVLGGATAASCPRYGPALHREAELLAQGVQRYLADREDRSDAGRSDAARTDAARAGSRALSG